MSRKGQPRFLFKLRIGAPDGDPVDMNEPDYSEPWLWCGGKSRMVRYEGKPTQVERAIYNMFSGKKVLPGFQVRRIKGTDPADFRPMNFYAVHHSGSAGFSLTQGQADLVEFLEEAGVSRLSSLEEEYRYDLIEENPDDVRAACGFLDIEVDIELPGGDDLTTN